jgi:hypothetical protein
MANSNFHDRRDRKKMRKLNSDSLIKMSDGDVNRIHRDVRLRIRELNQRLKGRSNRGISNELNHFEIEFCYLEREIEVRNKRKIAHENFMNSKQRKSFQKR